MGQTNLVDKATEFFKMSQETPGGKRAIDFIRWHQLIPFIVSDKPEFYLDVQRGSVKVISGEAPRQDKEKEFYDVSRVYTNSETLNRILEGKEDSVESQFEEGTFMLVPTGNYSQSSFLHLLFGAGRAEILEKIRRGFEESE
jgi:hypothetical protein